ncbi:hypothetical protein D7231_24450 [Streptomyces klenkii]|uniref:Adenylyl-sulfate kinase n=1 Tax=Streptomyces klenkii TaxID=1420899 RepID=A0A3B0AZI1_9ACTN|nr:hypothetical protein [Streptomyces klenkii]RKN65955.1 hypothetical protein D7231_24450 [Streptomyces klenkii]
MNHHDRASRAEPRALLITGTVGVGKTSAADLLGDLLSGAGVPHAVMDLDRLCQSWPAPEDDPFNAGLLLRNLRALTANYLDAGVRRLVLAGVAENTADLDGYQAAIGMPLTVCRLTADLPVVHSRLRSRHEADNDPESLPWHLERAGQLHQILDQADIADFAIDTTHVPLPAVASTILKTAGWT